MCSKIQCIIFIRPAIIFSIGVFSSDLLVTFYMTVQSLPRLVHTRPISFPFIRSLILSHEEYKLYSFLLLKFIFLPLTSSILNQNTFNIVLKHAQCMFFTQGYSIYIMVLFAKQDQCPATYLKDVRVEMEKGSPWCV